MRTALVAALALLASCGSNDTKPPYVDTLDPDFTGDAKADSRSRHATLAGSLSDGQTIAASFLGGGYVGYTLAAEIGDTLLLTLDSDDADPVLYLYGPQRPTGSWGNKIALNDDASPAGTGARIEHLVTQRGTYLVLAAEHDHGPGTFRLSLDVNPEPPPPPPVCESVIDFATCQARPDCNAELIDVICFRVPCADARCTTR